MGMEIFALSGVVLVIFVIGISIMLTRFYRKVEQGKALIINKMGKDPVVTFTGGVVLPIIHKAEVMDISVKTIEIDRRGSEGLICCDNIRADIKVTFFVRVNKTEEDVIKVAQAIGCARASDKSTLEELFNAKFSEALKTVGKQLDFVDLYTKRDDFRDQIIQVIGRDLNGYVLEDAAIDYLEQTPLEKLDPQNILDAQGIRKITELTAAENVRTNAFRNDERKQIKKQDVEAQEAILELERQQADAEAKQRREIESVMAREQAETQKIQSEERQKSELARIRADEEISVNEENKKRQIEVAEKNRERVVAVETERVEKDRALEAIAREREVELQRIAKEKELEKEKREIANVIRERIAVERTVAEEEERIKRLRVVEEAERTKEATVIAATAEAEEMLVKGIKAAEASEQAAKFKAKERLTLAEAELEAADREARAKIRLAEGVQAETAAPGLADVKVKEADAVAVEKLGMAQVRVKEANADATEKVGRADANVLREKGLAEAQATRERMLAEAAGLSEKEAAVGLAQVRVKDADAAATEKLGDAEAKVLRGKLVAEAAGIAEKAAALRALDEPSRGHEEYRLRLEQERAIALSDIQARREVAEAQARLLGEALSKAKIDIVGGESVFVDRLVNAVAWGKSVDSFVDRSDRVQTLLGDYLSGNADLPKDLKEALSGLSSGDLANLSLTAFLGRLMAGASGEKRANLQKLLDAARSLGVDEARG